MLSHSSQEFSAVLFRRLGGAAIALSVVIVPRTDLCHLVLVQTSTENASFRSGHLSRTPFGSISSPRPTYSMLLTEPGRLVNAARFRAALRLLVQLRPLRARFAQRLTRRPLGPGLKGGIGRAQCPTQSQNGA